MSLGSRYFEVENFTLMLWGGINCRKCLPGSPKTSGAVGTSTVNTTSRTRPDYSLTSWEWDTMSSSIFSRLGDRNGLCQQPILVGTSTRKSIIRYYYHSQYLLISKYSSPNPASLLADLRAILIAFITLQDASKGGSPTALPP